MKFIKTVGVIVVVLCSLAAPLLATAANPSEVITYVGNKPPLGSSSVSSLIGKLYDVSVWTQGQRLSWNKPFILRLTYARQFSRQEIVDASLLQMGKLQNIDSHTDQQYRRTFATIFPDVKKGDAISAVYLPNNALIFYFNGKKIGVITNMKLAHDFLDIWFSDHGDYPEVRKSILKLSSKRSNLRHLTAPGRRGQVSPVVA